MKRYPEVADTSLPPDCTCTKFTGGSGTFTTCDCCVLSRSMVETTCYSTLSSSGRSARCICSACLPSAPPHLRFTMCLLSVILVSCVPSFQWHAGHSLPLFPSFLPTQRAAAAVWVHSTTCCSVCGNPFRNWRGGRQYGKWRSDVGDVLCTATSPPLRVRFLLRPSRLLAPHCLVARVTPACPARLQRLQYIRPLNSRSSMQIPVLHKRWRSEATSLLAAAKEVGQEEPAAARVVGHGGRELRIVPNSLVRATPRMLLQTVSWKDLHRVRTALQGKHLLRAT